MPATFKHIVLLLNPAAGTSGIRKFISALPTALRKMNLNLETIFSEKPGDIKKLAADHAGSGNLILVAGGDGSVHEAALGVMNAPASLGIIPTGSGNGFARHLGISHSPELALKQLLTSSKTVTSDMGRLNDQYFINTAGIGFDGRVAKTFSQDGSRGLKTYIKHTLINYFSFREFEYALQFDPSTLKGKAWMITIANASEFGNGARIAPGASVTDGLLDIAIVKKPKWYQVPGLIFTVMTGKERSNLIQRMQLSGFSLQLNEEQEMHLDGEYAGGVSTVKCTVVPSCIKIQVPTGAARI